MTTTNLRSPSILGAVALLTVVGCNAASEPVVDELQDNAELSDLGPDGFVAQGTWMGVVDEAPVEISYDHAAGLARIDVLATAPISLILDWSEDRAGSYLIAGDRCFTGPLPRAEMPTLDELVDAMPDSLDAFRSDGSEPLALTQPEGTSLHMLLNTDPLFMVVRLDNIAALDADRSAARADFDTLLASCTSSVAIADAFGTKHILAPEDTSEHSTVSGSWIETNRYFTSPDVTWVGPSFQIDKSAYDSNYSVCWNSSNCRANLTLEGGFRYGYHCGAGWGGAPNVLDPVDAACQYHDRHEWGDSEREGWCGLAAALACHGDSDWFWDIWFLEFFYASAARDSIQTFASSACLANGGWPGATVCY